MNKDKGIKFREDVKVEKFKSIQLMPRGLLKQLGSWDDFEEEFVT